MKRTITGKIIFSYLLVILISLLFVGTFFSISAKRYIERMIQNNLEKSAASISGVVRGELNILRRDTPGDIEAPEMAKIMQSIREIMRRSTLIQGSSYAIISREQRIVFPRTGEDAERFKNSIFPIVMGKAGNSAEDRLRFKVDNIEYMAVVLPITTKADGTNIHVGWVVLYTGIEQLDQIGRGVLYVLFIASLFSAIIAVIFGIIIARSIAKPILLVKKRAERLSTRDFDTRVDINTGDELEELANTINKMAVELKEYDIAQKKFIQNASHELKTPLMSIQGYAEGIKDGVFDNNEKALDVIVDESKRLKSIVEELIFLSKLESMEGFYKFVPNSINEVIEKSSEKLKSLAIMSNVNINILPNRDISITMDRDKFIQAMINIIGNCLRYAKREIIISTKIEGDHIEIQVCDDGDGFDPEELKNAFERFYKGKKGNTGLGLAITKVIIEKHNGTIEAGNRPGGGAVFKMRLGIK